MIGAVALLLLLQDAPLDAERERIRSKPPLTAEEKQAYSLPAAAAVRPKAAYSVAVIPVGFTDKAPGGADPAKFFFTDLAGWLGKVSGGGFALTGRLLEPAKLGVERGKFQDVQLAAALAGRDLAGFDGVAFVAAGGIGRRGTPLWPHFDAMRIGGRRVEYALLAEEAGTRALGIAAHEFMHLLGLEDKYDDPKAPVGRACLLGTGYDDRDPQPPCADCREKLGWTVPGKVAAGASASIVLEAGPARSVKALVNPDGSEYLLFEMREKLLAWHVGGGMKIAFLGSFPSEESDRLTPLSDPPFRGRSVGARPLWVTDIRVEEGKAWFRVAPEGVPTPLEAWRRSRTGRRLRD